MRDCNGKELAVGDRAWKMAFHYPAKEIVIGSIFNKLDGGRCRLCRAREAATVEGDSDHCVCGCILVKITPDADQFTDETTRELEKT